MWQIVGLHLSCHDVVLPVTRNLNSSVFCFNAQSLLWEEKLRQSQRDALWPRHHWQVSTTVFIMQDLRCMRFEGFAYLKKWGNCTGSRLCQNTVWWPVYHDRCCCAAGFHSVWSYGNLYDVNHTEMFINEKKQQLSLDHKSNVTRAKNRNVRMRSYKCTISYNSVWFAFRSSGVRFRGGAFSSNRTFLNYNKIIV